MLFNDIIGLIISFLKIRFCFNIVGGILMRLDKFLANMGFGSRREVRILIKRKLVTVNDKFIKDNSVKINPDNDRISVNGNEVIYEKYIYFMLNKPQGYLSATKDNYQKTVLDLIPKEYKHYHLFPVGRLDIDTEGLLLITNDGNANHQLISPKKNIPKVYYAKIDGKVLDSHVERFKNGLILDDGYKTKQAYLDIIHSASISEIKLTITEGKFHQVKRMFQSLGMKVLYLKRIQMGNIKLDLLLKKGEVRKLNDEEVNYIESIKIR